MKSRPLLEKALQVLLAGFTAVALLLFIPAGTVYFQRGWLFLAVLFLPMIGTGLVAYRKAPDLLEKRLNGREKQKAQVAVTTVLSALLPVHFIVCGLDYRFHWSSVPVSVTAGSVAIFLTGDSLYPGLSSGVFPDADFVSCHDCGPYQG